jgi:hypothetical protein
MTTTMEMIEALAKASSVNSNSVECIARILESYHARLTKLEEGLKYLLDEEKETT